MGRKIITNNKDSWELYSTNSDSVIAKFKTEKDLKEDIANEIIYNGKLDAIKELMAFPSGWTVNNKLIPENPKEYEKYYEWRLSISQNSKTYQEFYKMIDEKLAELLK